MWWLRSKLFFGALIASIGLSWADQQQMQPTNLTGMEIGNLFDSESLGPLSETIAYGNNDTVIANVFADIDSEDIVLDSNETSPFPASKTATRSIRLQPGFKYTALDISSLGGNKTYSLSINEEIPFSNYRQEAIMTDTAELSNELLVGSIQGQFSRSASGAAIYSIPLELPQGMNGFVPGIALRYNSQSGNGYVGEGWNLQGLSCITRDEKNVFYDGVALSYDWTRKGVFSLDGVRLRLVSSSGDSAVYAPSEDNPSDCRKVVGYEIKDYGPSFFKVYYKNGEVWEYGDSGATYAFVRKFAGKCFQWMLRSKTDRFGNTQTYKYVYGCENDGLISHRLKEILYGGNKSSNVSNFCRILFEYESREDTILQCVDGYRHEIRRRLSRVEASVKGKVFRTYELEYRLLNGRSSLSTILMKGTDGKAYPCTSIEWIAKPTQSPLNMKESHLDIVPNNSVGLLGVDYDGNGISDLIVRQIESHVVPVYGNSGVSGFYAEYKHNYQGYDSLRGVSNADKTISYTTATALVQDASIVNENHGPLTPCYFDRLDKPRILIPSVRYGSQQLELMDLWSGETLISVSLTASNGDIPFIQIADFNRDGYDDVLVVEKSSRAILSYGGTLRGRKREFIIGNGNGNVHDVLAVDMNNDGFCDLAALCNDKLYLYRNEVVYKLNRYVNNLTEMTKIKDLSLLFVNKLSRGDFNGDGVADLLLSGVYSYICLLDGSFGIMNSYRVAHDWSLATNPIVIDYNNDGKSDLLCVNKALNGICWLKSEGRGFVADLEFSTTHCPSINQIAVGDFDGDGITDILSTGGSLLQDSGTDKILFYRTCDDYAAGKVKSLTDGFGVVLEFNYRPLTDNSIYCVKPLFNRTDGLIELTEPMCVLSSSVKKSPNREILSKEAYHYMGGCKNNQGRGFLGFSEVTCTDMLKEQLVAETTQLKILQDIPWMLPSCRTVSLLSGDVMSKTTMQYSISTLRTGATYCSLDKKEERDYALGTLITETKSYDDCGNVVERVMNYNDGSLVLEEFEYQRVYAWCLDRPKSMRRVSNSSGEQSIMRTCQWLYDINQRTMDVVLDWETPMSLTKHISWNSHGQPLSECVTDGVDSLVSINRYDDMGRLIYKKDAVGRFHEYVYNEWSECISDVTEFGTRSFEYDGFGRLKIERDFYGHKHYCIRRPSDALGVAFYEIYMGDGIPTRIKGVDFSGRDVVSGLCNNGNRMVYRNSVYDKKGLLRYVSVPYYENEGNVRIAHSYHYDSWNRLTLDIDYLDNSSTAYAYSGLLMTVTTPSMIKKERRNARGWIVESETNGMKVNYEYRPDGYLTVAAPFGLPSVNFTYDKQGNRTGIDDPDAGVVRWSYDSFGRVKRETKMIHLGEDSLCRTFAYRNGLLHEMCVGSRIERFSYDRGLLVSDVVEGEFSLHNQYDSYGNLIEKTLEIADSVSYTNLFEYDDYGRNQRVQFPSGVGLEYEYDNAGFLIQSRLSNGSGSWQMVSSDESNRVTEERLGMLLKTTIYNRNGTVAREYCGSAMDNQYMYSSEGLLVGKEDGVSGQCASYEYDHLGRLKDCSIHTATGNFIDSYQYDNAGNMSFKSDLGDFLMEYDSDRPHAIKGITGVPFVMATENLSLSYTDFGKVSSVAGDNREYQIFYGPNDQRIRSCIVDGDDSETHDYFDNYEEVKDACGNVRKIHYLCNNSGVWGVYVQNTHKSDSLYYAMSDYQHNLVALTDSSGNVVRRYAFDAWGGRRMADNWSVPDTLGGWITSRGFSMHEHLDGFDLINMNGRVYDPLTSQFLSPDLVVQAPDNWLNYNRYAYCLNNPVKYWDPSGYFATETSAYTDMLRTTSQGAVVTDQGVYQLPNGDWRYNTVEFSTSDDGSCEITITNHYGDLDGMYPGSRFSYGMYGQSQGGTSGWYDQYRKSMTEVVAQQSTYNWQVQRNVQKQELMAVSAWNFASGLSSGIGGYNEGLGVLGSHGYTYGSNGKFYASGWRGNGYVSTTKVGKIGSLGAGATAVGVLCEVPEVVEGYKKDGCQVGYNFGKEVAGGVGSWGGSVAGALLGAKVGALAPPYGPLIGGAVVGVLGGIFGESGVEYVYDLFMKP